MVRVSSRFALPVSVALSLAILCCSRAPITQAPSGSQSQHQEVPAATAHEITTLKSYLANHPGDPAGLFNLALDEASIGNKGRAIDLLEQMAQAHAGLDPAGGEWRGFKSIAADPRFTAVVAQVRKENPPVSRSVVAYTIAERDLAPEGIAWDPVGRKLYLSSISKRKIVAVGLDGSVIDFKSSGQDGLGITLGMKVDSKRRLLWVVTDSPDEAPKRSLAAVFEYDLKTGALLFKHQLPPGSEGFLNDVALASTGEAFATNTGTGEVFRMSPSRDGTEPFLPRDAVGQANGIVVAPGDKILFVAGWLGVARVDLASRQYKLLAKPRNISDANLDGLYFYKDSLIGIQNPDLHPGRVVRYYLNPAMDTIVRADVLEAYSPLLELPTTGTLQGDSLLFMSNTQIDRELPNHTMPPAGELSDIRILRLKL